MQIGDLHIDGKVFLAPMAGVTDYAFRELVKEIGCSLLFSEMISSKATVYEDEKTWRLVEFGSNQRPLGIQLFGCEPDTVATAAAIVDKRAQPDLIDINMGCPAPKIVNNFEGSALMKDPEVASKIVKAVVQAVDCPVTVKMRKGFTETTVNAVEVAQVCVAAGAQMVTVHGRTRDQYYSGEADWDIIRQVKDAVEVPVVGNGDIFEPQDAQRMIEQTGCDAVMIGRGARGNPWLCWRTEVFLSTGEDPGPPTMAELFTVMKKHFDLVVANKGEYVAAREMRSHLAWYLKGFPHAANMRHRINHIESREEAVRLLDDYYNELVVSSE